MQRITPFLWFDNQAVEAAKFYVSIFPNSRLLSVAGFENEEHGVDGATTVVRFELEGLEFTGLNGGPVFKFTPAISMMVSCKDQAEVDELWDKLVEGGAPSACGWLTDRYGLSWQIVPKRFFELMEDPDKTKVQRVAEAMMKMIKFDISALEEAYKG